MNSVKELGKLQTIDFSVYSKLSKFFYKVTNRNNLEISGALPSSNVFFVIPREFDEIIPQFETILKQWIQEKNSR